MEDATTVVLKPGEMALVQRALEDWFQEWSGVAWPPVTPEMVSIVEKFDVWQRTREWVEREFQRQQGEPPATG